MAELTVTIPDADARRIATAVCAITQHVPVSDQDAIDHVRSVVFGWLRDATINWEADQAALAIRTNIDDPLVSAVVTQGEG
jgi:hypothetical protein